MPADVNVTEKVARALHPSAFDPNGWVMQCYSQTAEEARKDAQDRAIHEARNALSVLSDPEVLAGIAGVLYEADPLPGKPSWDGLRSESAKWPDGVARWAETRALERAAVVADWLRGQG